MKKFVKDFKEFISKGNVFDLAIAVVIGAAFGSVVSGFVTYILNPLLGLVIPNGGLDGLKTIITEASVDASGKEVAEVAILWGTWIQTIVNFLIIALCIFIMVRAMTKAKNALNKKQLEEKYEAEKKAKEEENAANAAKAQEEADFRNAVFEIRDYLKNK